MAKFIKITNSDGGAGYFRTDDIRIIGESNDGLVVIGVWQGNTIAPISVKDMTIDEVMETVQGAFLEVGEACKTAKLDLTTEA